eukprot:scaffold7028_cov243-Pinguiococcus_pyrenoidosus.AAC.24
MDCRREDGMDSGACFHCSGRAKSAKRRSLVNRFSPTRQIQIFPALACKYLYFRFGCNRRILPSSPLPQALSAHFRLRAPSRRQPPCPRASRDACIARPGFQRAEAAASSLTSFGARRRRGQVAMAHRAAPSSVTRKVAVLGSRGVGKSAIVTTFVNGEFPETYVPTIESTYRKSILFGRVQFYTEIVDTAGMDEYSRLSRNATIGCHGYVLVFALSNRQSFAQVQHINDVLTEMLGYAPNIPRVLVGSMADLEDQRQVEQAEAMDLADGWGVPYVESSALDDFNVG